MERFRRGAAALHAPPQEWHAAQPFLHRLDQAEHERVDQNGEDGRGQDEAILLGGQQAQGDPCGADDEREFADLAEPGGDDDHRSGRRGQHEAQQKGDEGLAADHQQGQDQNLVDIGQHHGGVHEHADRYEEEDGEEIAKGDDLGPHLVVDVGFADDDAGQKRAQGQRDAE